MNKPDRIAALTHIGCPAIVFDTSAPLPMRLLSIRPVGRLMTKLQPPSEHQFEQLAKMVNEHPLPREIAQLIFTTERLAHFEDTFLAVLNRLLRLRGDRPDLALAAYQLARIQAPTLLVFAENGRMGAAPIGSPMAPPCRPNRPTTHHVPRSRSATQRVDQRRVVDPARTTNLRLSLDYAAQWLPTSNTWRKPRWITGISGDLGGCPIGRAQSVNRRSVLVLVPREDNLASFAGVRKLKGLSYLR